MLVIMVQRLLLSLVKDGLTMVVHCLVVELWSDLTSQYWCLRCSCFRQHLALGVFRDALHQVY